MVNNFIKEKRLKLGLSQKEFSVLLGLREQGERTVRGWENNEHTPSIAKLALINGFKTTTPFKQIVTADGPRFVDLFAGIGGMRLAFQNLGGQCVFSSEWDKFCQKTYAANFGEMPLGDITEIDEKTIPDHDILVAGFPCQAFSQAGLKKGFSDTRGTLFFEIQRILAAKKPPMFLLENVKQLKGHDKGNTLKTILGVLSGDNFDLFENNQIKDRLSKTHNQKLNYHIEYKVLKSTDFGIPQNRNRIFIAGFSRDYFQEDIFNKFKWPTPFGIPTSVQQILEPDIEIDEKYTISQKLLDGHTRRKLEHKKKGNGFGFSVFKGSDPYTNTISARYYKDGSEVLVDQSHLGKRPRKLTPRECANLQGFPKDFIVDAVSDGQAYKQFGNSVSVPVVQAIATKMIEVMRLVEHPEN